MSWSTLEREILRQAKILLNNKKLKLKDILAWSTGDVKAECDAEIVVWLANPGVNLCVLKQHDKRV